MAALVSVFWNNLTESQQHVLMDVNVLGTGSKTIQSSIAITVTNQLSSQSGTSQSSAAVSQSSVIIIVVVVVVVAVFTLSGVALIIYRRRAGRHLKSFRHVEQDSSNPTLFINPPKDVEVSKIHMEISAIRN